jgi:c-di-GMP-related signal transduction protein
MKAALSSQNKRFLGRQAILDANLNLYGYELLFRAGEENVFSGGAEEATNQVIDSCISMAACSSMKHMFINCTRDVLLDMRVKLLPARCFVLEVLETVEVDEEVVRVCKALKACGFRIALDDFTPEGSRVELVKIADYIKIDFRSTTPEERRAIYFACKESKARFIAEKVESQAELAVAKAEGNIYFQGYFHSKPEIISEAQIPARKFSYLQILAQLAQRNVDHAKVREILLTEPSLCYRLLRLANSPLYGLRSPVNTIQSALTIVGEEQFKKMVVVALVGMLPRAEDGRDLAQTLERAYFCESLAPALNESPAELYMLGMLSKINTLLGIEMGRLIDLLNLSPRMRQALLGSPDGLGQVLDMCNYYEHWSENHAVETKKPEYQKSAPLYFEAILSAGKVLRELNVIR